MTKKSFLKQFAAIFINNLIINKQRLLIMKEMAMIYIILVVCLIKVRFTPATIAIIYSLNFIIVYSILVMIFISRSEVTLFIDNR